MTESEINRYRKQILVKQLGQSGQESLRNARILIAGCGALGSAAAVLLARAGAGFLRLADRDTVDLSNLHRQILYDEKDALGHEAKAYIAAERLREYNQSVRTEAAVVNITADTADSLTEDIDLILDCTDNFETRFILNEVAVRKGIPWIYTGVIGTEGMLKVFLPDSEECLRCYIPELPEAGKTENCDTAGILSTTVFLASSLQVNEAIKILTGKKNELLRGFVTFDIWEGSLKKFNFPRRKDSCPVCGKKNGSNIPAQTETDKEYAVASFCGRDSWQITPLHLPDQENSHHERIYSLISAKCGGSKGDLVHGGFVWKKGKSTLKIMRKEVQIILFSDGRFVVENAGNRDFALALVREIMRICSE